MGNEGRRREGRRGRQTLCLDSVGASTSELRALEQMGGLSLGEGGSGDPGGNGAFSEGMVVKGMTDDATDDAIQASIVKVFSK